MFKGKKVIIFDMDGTLIDSVGVWNEVDKALIKRINNNAEINRDVDIQEQRDSALRRYSKEANPYLAYCEFLGRKYGSQLTGEEIIKLRYEIAQEYLQNTIDYKPDVEVLLKELKKRGFILVIASTTKKTNMEIYRTKNKNIMTKAMIDEYFSLVFTREDAKEIKPNPEIYLRVMQELGVNDEECLIFEDSLIGIEAAKGAGIEVVAIHDKYSDADREEINKLSNYQFNAYSDIIKELKLDIAV